MTPCSSCHRLTRSADSSCPFCGTRLRGSVAPLAVALVGLTMGCSPAVDGPDASDDADGTTTIASSSTSVGSSSGATASASSTTTFASGTDTGDMPTTTGISSGFIYGSPDGGGNAIECSTWDQDCAKDEKCMPWANDGGTAWNATRCTPLADDPHAVGEPCTAEGTFVSGIDTCEGGAICRGSDDETLEGICIEMCSGSPEAPICDDTESATCTGTVVPLCLPICDPLLGTCADGFACVPVASGWECMPEGPFLPGEPCEFVNACLDGAACLAPDAQCPEGSAGCCTSICDLSDPDPDLGCLDGQTCMPFYEDGEAVPGYEDVGICRSP